MNMMNKTKRGIVAGALLLTTAFSFAGAGLASPEQLAPTHAMTRSVIMATPALEVATERNSNRVRELLAAFHGSSRAQFDAISTHVPEILMEFIAGEETPVFIKRNAIKALRFYPTEKTFQFTQRNIDSSPVNLQKLYLLNLRAFSQDKPEAVIHLIAPHMESSEVVVRHIAVSVLSSMKPHPAAQTLLRQRLEVEGDLELKQEIRRHLIK